MVVHLPAEDAREVLRPPPGGRYFGCRHCYRLTHASCQESHVFDRMFVGLAAAMGTTPQALKRALSSKS